MFFEGLQVSSRICLLLEHVECITGYKNSDLSNYFLSWLQQRLCSSSMFSTIHYFYLFIHSERMVSQDVLYFDCEIECRKGLPLRLLKVLFLRVSFEVSLKIFLLETFYHYGPWTFLIVLLLLDPIYYFSFKRQFHTRVKTDLFQQSQLIHCSSNRSCTLDEISKMLSSFAQSF